MVLELLLLLLRVEGGLLQLDVLQIDARAAVSSSAKLACVCVSAQAAAAARCLRGALVRQSTTHQDGDLCSEAGGRHSFLDTRWPAARPHYGGNFDPPCVQG